VALFQPSGDYTAAVIQFQHSGVNSDPKQFGRYASNQRVRAMGDGTASA
jgi:hypothetical protein